MPDRLGKAPISTGASNPSENINANPRAKEIFARWKSLKNKRANWEWQWQDVLKYIVPQKDFITRRRSIQGESLDKDIYDTTARIANQIMAAGFQGNLTNPATRWFRLRLQDSTLNEPRDVRQWLDQSQDIAFKNLFIKVA